MAKAKTTKKVPTKKATPMKDTKKAEAEEKAASVGDINGLKELIVKDVCLMVKGKKPDIQLAIECARKLMAKKDPTTD